MTRLHWPPIIDRAAEIVRSYGGGVTLRQLFYRLLSESLIPNTHSAYKGLSSRTARARRAGTFPALVDHTRRIHTLPAWESPREALQSLVAQYRQPRTDGQDHAFYIGAEKATLQSLLDLWFSELGIPVILLRGYSSQTYLDDITAHWDADGRDPVLIYAGDLDPSGEDIERDFMERTPQVPWKLIRVAVQPEQIGALRLAKQAGKSKDPRAPAFIAKHGELFQVEVEAIEPDTLRALYQDALDRYWAPNVYAEEAGRSQLQDLVSSL